MATLISSKQISGVVTASVINGEFLVSGSSTLTGSLFIQGDVSASSISASTFQGSGTNLTFGGSGFITSSAQVSLPSVAGYTFFSQSISSSIAEEIAEHAGLPHGLFSGSSQVDYDELTDKPAFIGGTNVTVTSGSGGISISAVLEGSAEESVTYLNLYTESADLRLDQIETFTSSNASPAGTVSGSAQITAFGFISESSENTSLNTYTASNEIRLSGIDSATASLDQRLDQIESNTGSYDDQTVITSLNSFTASIDTTIKTKINTDGVVSGSLSSSIAYDGNRTVSNTDLPSGVYNNNFGTSGSIIDFVEAVFFPNTAPTINSTQFTIAEFLASGSTVGSISATDAEGQSMTFTTQSAYTDDKVKVSTGGVITLTETATSSSYNTALSGSIHAHELEITATDTFGGATNKTIHIIVTPNEAPKFREGSVGGNVITNVTASLNENSSNSTLVKRVFFTDAESDTITINSSSISPAGGSSHFTITKSSTYVDITQNTGSLDYETYPSYTFSLTASDEHKIAGQDADAFVTLPVSISVADNAHPTINNQTLSAISENSSNGATVGSISATDVDSDTITFSDFTLYKLELDNSNVVSGSYGGTSQASDPHENPFQMTSAGVVTRKNGVHINSDIINEYQYTVIVKDNFNTASNEGIITIPISDDTPASISTNGTFRIVESAVSGALIRTNANGFSGTQADLSSNQSGTFSNSSNPAIAVNSSNGNLSLAVDLSGSATQSGDTIVSNVTFTNTFGTTTVQSVTANVVGNSAPTISFTNQSSNFETDLALDGVTMVSMSVSDTESDVPFSASLSGVSAGSLKLVYTNANSSSIQLQANGNLSAATYTYNIKIDDAYGETTTYSDRSFAVAESPDYGKVYIYRSNYGSDSGLSDSYNSVMGISTVNGSTPPEVTAFTANSTSPMRLISSSLGDATLNLAGGGAATRVAILSGSDLDTIISASNPYTMGNTAEQYIIIAPSGSDMIGIPTSMTDSFGGSTAGEYVMSINADGGGFGNENSTIHLLDTSGSINGFDKHFVIGRKGHNAAASVVIRLTESSGSIPS